MKRQSTLNTKYPTAPLFTIHDAVCTFPEYLPDLQQLILERFYEITGALVGLKPSSLISSTEPKQEDNEEEWKDIRAIRTPEKFAEMNYYVTNEPKTRF